MPAFQGRDAANNIINFFAVTGDGTAGSPFLVGHGDENLGVKADVAATTDGGTFSLISLLKRLLAKLPGLSATGRLPVEIAPDTTDISAVGTAASGVIKASPGTLFMITCTNDNASTRYIQIFNSTTAPANGATPHRVYPVYGKGFTPIDTVWGARGLACPTGISWGYSTTLLTFTAGTPSECIFEARFN